MTRFSRRTQFAMAAVLSLALLATACGDDEAGGPGPYDSEFQGIWTVESWTENAESCDAEGESVLEERGNPLVLVQACTLNFGFKVDFLQALDCVDEADCEAKRCTENDLNLGGASFEEGDDKSGWTGKIIFTSGAPDDMCTGEVITHTLSQDGDALILRSEKVETPLFTPDAEGFCDTDVAESMAKGQPCVELEVRRLTQP